MGVALNVGPKAEAKGLAVTSPPKTSDSDEFLKLAKRWKPKNKRLSSDQRGVSTPIADAHDERKANDQAT